MKKVFRFTLCLLVMASLFCGFAVAAFADSSVEYNRNRTFTVSPDTDLFDAFKYVMPGDTLTENIVVSNSYRGADLVKIYLKAVPHTPEEGPHLSNEDYDKMMAFLSQLTLKVELDNGKLLSEDTADKTAGLTEPQLIARFERWSSKTVKVTATLEVPLTMGNEFADCFGEVDWMFLAEEIQSTDSPRTGDTSHIILYAGILLFSAAAAWFILFYLRRKKAE